MEDEDSIALILPNILCHFFSIGLNIFSILFKKLTDTTHEMCQQNMPFLM